MKPICKIWQMLLALSLCITASFSQAADFPSRVIKFVVPMGPGSGLDSNARFIAEKAAILLGQPIIVENHPGGSTIIGTEYVLKAPADGYTVLLISPSSMIINPIMRKDISYDAQRDILPISGMNRSGTVLVVPNNSPYKSLQDVVTASKAKPGSVSVANYSDYYRFGSALLGKELGVTFTDVSFKGASEVLTSVSGGHVDIGLTAFGAAAPLVSSGKLRALAVTTKERADAPEYREVPTIQESGHPGFEQFVWTGFGVKAGTPAPIVKKLEQAISTVVAGAEFRNFLKAQGGEVPFTATGIELAELVRSDTERYKNILEMVK